MAIKDLDPSLVGGPEITLPKESVIFDAQTHTLSFLDLKSEVLAKLSRDGFSEFPPVIVRVTDAIDNTSDIAPADRRALFVYYFWQITGNFSVPDRYLHKNGSSWDRLIDRVMDSDDLVGKLDKIEETAQVEAGDGEMGELIAIGFKPFSQEKRRQVKVDPLFQTEEEIKLASKYSKFLTPDVLHVLRELKKGKKLVKIVTPDLSYQTVQIIARRLTLAGFYESPSAKNRARSQKYKELAFRIKRMREVDRMIDNEIAGEIGYSLAGVRNIMQDLNALGENSHLPRSYVQTRTPNSDFRSYRDEVLQLMSEGVKPKVIQEVLPHLSLSQVEHLIFGTSDQRYGDQQKARFKALIDAHLTEHPGQVFPLTSKHVLKEVRADYRMLKKLYDELAQRQEVPSLRGEVQGLRRNKAIDFCLGLGYKVNMAQLGEEPRSSQPETPLDVFAARMKIANSIQKVATSSDPSEADLVMFGVMEPLPRNYYAIVNGVRDFISRAGLLEIVYRPTEIVLPEEEGQCAITATATEYYRTFLNRPITIIKTRFKQGSNEVGTSFMIQKGTSEINSMAFYTRNKG